MVRASPGDVVHSQLSPHRPDAFATPRMSLRIASARDEVVEAISATQEARTLAPQLDAELERVEERLTSVRHRLADLAGSSSAKPSPIGSLYSWVASPDASPWEASLTAVMTVQIHTGVARSALFGTEPGDDDAEPEYDEPVPTLDGGDELSSAFEEIEASLDAARKRLRETPR